MDGRGEFGARRLRVLSGEALEERIEPRALEREEAVEEAVPATNLVNAGHRPAESSRDACERSLSSIDFPLDARVDAAQDHGLECGHERTIDGREATVFFASGSERSPELATKLCHFRGNPLDAGAHELGESTSRVGVVDDESVEDPMPRMQRFERRRPQAKLEIRDAFTPKR